MARVFLAMVLGVIMSLHAGAQTLDEGLKLMDYQKYEAAKRVFTTLSTNEPGNADYQFYLGDIYFQLGEEEKAWEFYNKAYNSNPESVLGNVAKARTVIRNGQFAEADPYITKALTLAGPKNPDMIAKVAESYIMFQKKDPVKAIDILNKALEKNKKSAILLLTLGDAYLAKNDGSLAVQNYNRALELDPKSPKTNLRMGQLYSRVNNAEEALKYFNISYQLDSTYPPVYVELAENAYNSRRFTLAKQYYEKYLSMVENDVNAYKRYASFLYLTKDYEKAVSVITEILKTEESPVMYRLLGYSQLELKNCGEGIAAMDKYFSMYDTAKTTVFDYEYYGRLKACVGDDSAAVLAYEKAMAKDTSRFDLNMEVAKIYAKQKNYNEAARVYRTILTRYDDLYNNFELGKVYYNSKMFDSALVVFNHIQALKADFYLGYYWAARAQTNLDPTSEKGLAKTNYEKVIEIAQASEDPSKFKREMVEAYSYLGYYYYVKKDMAKAKESFTKVKELDPANKQAENFFKIMNQPKPKPKK